MRPANIKQSRTKRVSGAVISLALAWARLGAGNWRYLHAAVEALVVCKWSMSYVFYSECPCRNVRTMKKQTSFCSSTHKSLKPFVSVTNRALEVRPHTSVFAAPTLTKVQQQVTLASLLAHVHVSQQHAT